MEEPIKVESFEEVSGYLTQICAGHDFMVEWQKTQNGSLKDLKDDVKLIRENNEVAHEGIHKKIDYIVYGIAGTVIVTLLNLLVTMATKHVSIGIMLSDIGRHLK